MRDLPCVKPIAFVASPLAGPDSPQNVEFAIDVCRRIALETGYLPFAPHLYFTRFLRDEVPAERALGIGYARTMMTIAARGGFFVPTWRPGFSTGMLHEHELAKTLRLTLDIAKTPSEVNLLVDAWGRRFPPEG